jgi:hypothetical protein
VSEQQHYVACLDLTGRRVVVIGQAEQKVEALHAAGADVVVSDVYDAALLDDAWLVIVVDRSQGERVFADASAQIDFEHEQLAYELRRIRPWVKRNFHTYAERREYFRERVVKALQ